jgi:hypothetical protein
MRKRGHVISSQSDLRDILIRNHVSYRFKLPKCSIASPGPRISFDGFYIHGLSIHLLDFLKKSSLLLLIVGGDPKSLAP